MTKRETQLREYAAEGDSDRPQPIECQCFDRSRAIRRPDAMTFPPSALRTLADDHRLCRMPAKFRWAYQWAADEIERMSGSGDSEDHPDVRPWFHTTTEPGPYTEDPEEGYPYDE